MIPVSRSLTNASCSLAMVAMRAAIASGCSGAAAASHGISNSGQRDAAVGHDHDHRLDFSGRQQIVHDKPCAADGAPARILVAAAVDEIEHWIFRIAPLVPRRRVDVHAARSTERLRVVPNGADFAVRYRLQVFEGGLRTRHQEHAVQAGYSLLDHRVSRVDGAHAVHIEGVAVEVGDKRSHGERPDSLVVLLHRPGGAAALRGEIARQRYGAGLGRVNPEHHAVVRQDLGGFQVGRPAGRLSEGHGNGQGREDASTEHHFSYRNNLGARSARECRHTFHS